MMSTNGKGYLAGAAMMMLAWAAMPGFCAGGPSAEVVYEGAPSAQVGAVAGGRGETLLAQNVTPAVTGKAMAAAVPVALVQDENTSPAEKIKVVFEKPEQDIITQQALEKLNVVIESLEFANADLHNVIRIIGERLNINFIFDAEDISGKVTLRLHNVRLRDALDSILSSRKLAIVADRSGIFRIVPKERVGGKAVETKTEVLMPKWVSAQDLQKSLKGFISEGVGKMDFNEESNSLIVTEVPPQLEIIKDLINQIDKPERQVLIEARLADVNMGALRNLGTKWSATTINKNAVTHQITDSHEKSTIMGTDGSTQDTLIDRVTNNSYLGDTKVGTKETVTDLLHPDVGSWTSVNNQPLSTAGGLVPVLLNGFGMDKGQGTLSLGEKIGMFGNTYNLNAVFTALESRNVVEILANPRVTTLTNVPAKIDIIERIPYIQASGLTSGGTSVPTIAWEDAGVNIQVKPIITPNGYVRMEIILDQKIFRQRVGTGALDPPQIDERKATTNVICRDMNTVVLGGLRQQRRLEQSDGLPWLSQIPLLGWLFKDKSYDTSKNELVLMVTPRIITDDTQALTEREKHYYDKIDNDWHLPDYFFDDVHSQLDEKNRDLSKAKPESKAEKTGNKTEGPAAKPDGHKAEGKDENKTEIGGKA